jgi:hypothetical protein
MLLLRDLLTTSGDELVWHLQHPEGNSPHQYQPNDDPCNKAYQYRRGQALLQASADALVKNGVLQTRTRTLDDTLRNKAPAMVSGYEIRRRSENGSMIAPRFGVPSHV